jgi:GNAT superfamily N-acetyltransferase
VSEDRVPPADLDPHDAAGRAAAGRFALTAVSSAKDPAFGEAFDALHAEFGHRGELERREVIEAWLAESPPPERGGISRSYHLVVARDERGSLAGVRDCHATFDQRGGVAVVYLAHTLVLPAFRRSGLAALLRSAARALGRAHVATRAREAQQVETLLAAEMEPADATASDTVVRLVAYGRAGFRAVAPEAIRYQQPDFRDLAVVRETPAHLPLLAVVRWIGHEGETSMPVRLAEAFVRHLYAVFETHCRAADLEAPRAASLASLAAAGERVPLLPLPSSDDDREAIARLSREVVARIHRASPC